MALSLCSQEVDGILSYHLQSVVKGELIATPLFCDVIGILIQWIMVMLIESTYGIFIAYWAAWGKDA